LENSTPFAELALVSHQLNLIVFDEEKEVITRWSEQIPTT